jgi:hypothetical protein
VKSYRRTPLEKAYADVKQWNTRESQLIKNNRPLNPARQKRGGKLARRKSDLLRRAKSREIQALLRSAMR